MCNGADKLLSTSLSPKNCDTVDSILTMTYSHSSKKLLINLLEQFSIMIGCFECTCLKLKSCETITASDLNHNNCHRNRLIVKKLADSNSEWQIVRCSLDFYTKPLLCQSSGISCSHFESCPYAHNETELSLWKEAQKLPGVFLEKFFSDILGSTLYADIFLQYLKGKKYDIKMLCKACVKTKNFFCAVKAKHRPKCQADHDWKSEADVCVVNKSQEVYYFTDMCVSTSEITSLDEQIMVGINEINNQLKIGKDKMVKMFENPGGTQQKNGNNAEDNASFIEDNEQLSEICLYDSSDEVDNYDADLGNAYYKLLPIEEALLKQENDPEHFMLCKIKLEGTYEAIAVPINEHSSTIQINGRMNCGPCFDGDDVIVEIRSVKKLDADTYERRGKVIAIFKKIQLRKNATFICSPDDFQSNLMKPLCGTVPKIHIKNKDVYKNTNILDKNSYVALYEMNDNKLKFKKLVELNARNRQDKLFVVHITKWSLAYMYPSGYAEKYILEGTDLKSSQLVINYTCHVPKRYEVGDWIALGPNFGTAQFMNHYNIHADREDLRSEFILTVDPPDCKDIDDALSITVELDYYKVGVHIADVSFLVKKDSFLDKEAFKRCVSFYPKSKEGPIHMLPSELSEYCCSLLPDRDRPCISVIFNVDFSGNIISHKIFRSLICSKKKLTYSEAQELMYPRTSLQAHSGDILRNTLLSLDAVAKLLRHKRLGKSRHFLQFEKSIDTTIGHNFVAHFLVEELMIVANTLVASHLVKHYPKCTPLRKQGMPDKEEFDNWLKNYSHFKDVPSFIQRFLPVLGVENSGQIISEVPILKEVAELLSLATEQRDVQRIRELLCAEEFHPLHAVALNDWYEIQRSAEYICSGCTHLNDSRHFSLGVRFYTHFTSPIRRYIDIIVHRLLISSLIKCKTPVYTQKELIKICDQVNIINLRAKKYDKFCSSLVLASQLQSDAAFLPGILQQINDNNLSFAFPGVPKLQNNQKNIKFGHLDICEKPVREKNDMHIELTWKRRIYDTRHNTINCRSKISTEPLLLRNDINIRHISLALWKSMQEALEAGNDQRLVSDMQKVLMLANWNDSGKSQELTSEMQGTKIVQHHVPFTLKLERGTAMHIQFGAESVRGYIQPVITQLNLTPQFGICIQHMNDPVKCFADIATEPLMNQYSSLEEYQSIWRPLINMEAAYSAMRETDPVIIKNVSVELKQDTGNKKNSYYGKLCLEKLFCRERSINLVKSLKKGDEELHDYLCLKFELKSRKYEHSIVKSNIWVCHALAQHSNTNDDNEEDSRKNKSQVSNKFHVKFLVKHYISKPPQELFDEADLRCTVELHAKPLPHRYNCYLPIRFKFTTIISNFSISFIICTKLFNKIFVIIIILLVIISFIILIIKLIKFSLSCSLYLVFINLFCISLIPSFYKFSLNCSVICKFPSYYLLLDP